MDPQLLCTLKKIPLIGVVCQYQQHKLSFRDKTQRNDSSVTNTYFNAGKADGSSHGHVKHRNNPDGTTDYLYARDVEGNEYDV